MPKRRQFSPFNVAGLSSGGTGGGSSSVGGVDVGSEYIITGSGTAFTAAKSGATVVTAGQDIRTVISAIQADANGSNVAIQFGDGTSVLDIGTRTASFSGEWGYIILSGKITSAGTDATLSISSNISANSTADIANSNAKAISIGGTLTINDGRISAASSNDQAISITETGTLIVDDGSVIGYIRTNGAITINGGTVSSQYSETIRVNRPGLLTINGGTISSTGQAAILLQDGSLTMTNGTIRTTSNTAGYGIGIYVYSGSIVAISGGMIETTDTAIDNADGRVTITGGTVSSKNTKLDASTIFNEADGILTITGGTIKNTAGGYAINNNNAATIGAEATIVGDTDGVN